MDMNRRSFLKGVGGVSVALLFRSKSGVLEPSWVPDYERRRPSGAEVVVTPQNHFRPERLVVADNIARHFIIEGITIGTVALFAGNSVPAEMFSSSAIDVNMVLPVVMPGQEIRFQVRRVHAAKHPVRWLWDMVTFKKEPGVPFRGALIGSMVFQKPEVSTRGFPGRDRRAVLSIASDELF